MNAYLRVYSLLILLISSSCAAQSSWQHWKTNEGVIVSYKKHANGLFEVQASMTVANVTSSDFIALLSDTAIAPQWIENVIAVKLLERPTSNQALVYTQFDAPWPVSNRDMVSHSCYRAVSANQTELIIKGASNQFAERTEFIRIETLRASWLLTSISQGLKIRHTVFADPSGTLPLWVSNKVGLKSAYKTMIALRKQLTAKNFDPAEQVSQVGSCEGFIN